MIMPCQISSLMNRKLKNQGTHNPSDADGFSYGDGKAAEKIIDIIVKYENRLFP